MIDAITAFSPLDERPEYKDNTPDDYDQSDDIWEQENDWQE